MAETTVLRRTELDAERQALKARIVRFRRHVSTAKDDLQSASTSMETTLGEHPRALVGGSAAVGFVIGLLPNSLPHPDLEPVGVLKGAVAGLATTGVDGLTSEIGMVARDFLAGVVGKDKAGPIRVS